MVHGQAKAAGVYGRLQARTVRLVGDSGKSIGILLRELDLKTAKALGLTIAPSLLLRADQVIE